MIPRFLLAIFLPVAMLACSGSSCAKVIQQGYRYQGPVVLEARQSGVAISLPKGWVGMWPEGSESMLIGNNTNQGSVHVLVERMSRKQLMQTMSQLMTLENGMVLQPKSSIKVQGNRLSADYAARQLFATYDAYMQTVVGDNGTAIGFIAVYQPRAKKSFRAITNRLAASVKFSRIKTPASAPDIAGSAIANWASYLSGKNLDRYYRSSGYHEHTTFSLCPGGRFYRRFSSGAYDGGGFTASGRGRGGGTWRVTGNSLVLQFSDGTRSVYTLSLNQNKLYLNNKRWYRGKGDCQ
jgi:hypothetical protein